MKSSKLILIIAALFAFIATSCNSSDDGPTGPMIPQNTLYDFATLETTNSSGSIFTLNKANDSETITYSSTVSLANNKDIKSGGRLVIAYTMLDGLQAYQSGRINLLGYILLNNTTSTVTDLTGVWSSSPVEADVITRTGNYINMQLQLFARNNTSRGNLLLVADPNKLDEAVPELFLVFDNDKNSGDNKYLAYASFNIGDIWSRKTCRGVKITYQTPNGVKSQTFNNNDVDVITPME